MKAQSLNCTRCLGDLCDLQLHSIHQVALPRRQRPCGFWNKTESLGWYSGDNKFFFNAILTTVDGPML